MTGTFYLWKPGLSDDSGHKWQIVAILAIMSEIGTVESYLNYNVHSASINCLCLKSLKESNIKIENTAKFKQKYSMNRLCKARKLMLSTITFIYMCKYFYSPSTMLKGDMETVSVRPSIRKASPTTATIFHRSLPNLYSMLISLKKFIRCRFIKKFQ